VSKVKNRKPVKCIQPDSDLIFYLEGSLSKERVSDLESHLSVCRVCSGFLESMKLSLRSIDKEKDIIHDPFFYTRVMARRQTGGMTKTITFKRFIPALVAATLFTGGVFTGINIGKLFPFAQHKTEEVLTQEKGYLDELNQESIESFFITTNEGENE
jgi:hypothetical protein